MSKTMIVKNVPAEKIERRSRVINRDPMPKTFTEANITGSAFVPNTTARLSYQNGVAESSEIMRILIKAPPLAMVTVKKTINNQESEMMPATRVCDLPEHGIIDFRRVANKPLTVGRAEYLYIDLVHTYVSNQSLVVVVDKNQLLWVDENVTYIGK